MSELPNILNYSNAFLSRLEGQYTNLNESINKLIDELGSKVKKQLVTIQEQFLINFKNNLTDAHSQYNSLQKDRNEQVIKHHVLELKNQQEQIFNEQSKKATQNNRICDKLKKQLKKCENYEHEIKLEIQYLRRQCSIARKKGKMLDSQIQEIQQNKQKYFRSTQLKYNRSDESIKCMPLYSTKNIWEQNIENRLKNKIDTIKDYLESIVGESNSFQNLFNKYEIQNCRTQKQKLALFIKILDNKQVKKYLYQILYKNQSIH